jgi:hypothetical protein
MIQRLPAEEQQAVREALAVLSAPPVRRRLQRLTDGAYVHPAGLPANDPVFDVLEKLEAERHAMPGPPAPDFD